LFHNIHIHIYTNSNIDIYSLITKKAIDKKQIVFITINSSIFFILQDWRDYVIENFHSIGASVYF
jgi:hypothetical protein